MASAVPRGQHVEKHDGAAASEDMRIRADDDRPGAKPGRASRTATADGERRGDSAGAVSAAPAERGDPGRRAGDEAGEAAARDTAGGAETAAGAAGHGAGRSGGNGGESGGGFRDFIAVHGVPQRAYRRRVGADDGADGEQLAHDQRVAVWGVEVDADGARGARSGVLFAD